MAELNITLLVRKGTTEEWASSQYVLKMGEWGLDTTTGVYKMGNGTDLWSALPAGDKNTTYTLEAGSAAGSVKLVGSDGSSDEAVITAITNANISASAGIEKSKLAAGVQSSLDLADSAVQSVTEGSANGQILVDGTAVSVHGLGSAAYTDSSEYATAAQGTLADSALQKADITTGGANGTIAVEGTDVAVKGLGSAAYTASGDYEAAGSVSAHNTDDEAHADIRQELTALAEKMSGRTTAYVYQNKEDPDYTAAIGKAGSFIVGDTIYFLDEDIADQWVTAVNDAAPFYTFADVETEHPDLSGYVTGSGLTADKIVLGAAGSAVKASAYGIATSLVASDASNVVTSKAVADYIAAQGFALATELEALESTVDGLETSKQDALVFDGTYNASTNKVATQTTVSSAVSSAIAALDNTDAAVSGQYVTAVKEADGVVTVERKQIAYSEISGTPMIPEVPDSIVESLTSGNDAITVSASSGDVTVTHKNYGTGNLSLGGETPYLINSMTIDKGHVSAINAIGLEAALAALGSITLNGGKADGTW